MVEDTKNHDSSRVIDRLEVVHVRWQTIVNEMRHSLGSRFQSKMVHQLRVLNPPWVLVKKQAYLGDLLKDPGDHRCNREGLRWLSIELLELFGQDIPVLKSESSAMRRISQGQRDIPINECKSRQRRDSDSQLGAVKAKAVSQVSSSLGN